MNRKGLLGGFTDLQWAGLTIIILIIFFVFVYATSGQTATQAVTPMNWEASWLATSYAQQPIGNQTLLEALRDPANDQAIDEALEQLVEQTTTSKRQFLIAYAVRADERVTCQATRLETGNTFLCGLIVSGSDPAWSRTPTSDYDRQRQLALAQANRAILKNPPDEDEIREVAHVIGVAHVRGLENTYVGVVVG